MKFDNLILIVVFLCVSITGGIFAGLVYTNIHLLDTELHNVDFNIPLAQNSTTGALNITTFQDVLELTVYPVMGLVDALPYLVYFMMFAFIIGLAITAYLTSKNPIFFVLHIIFTIVLTYFAIILSNTYQTLLSNPYINTMMVDFPIYNKLMLFLPQILFLTSLVFAGIAFVNVMKPQTAESPYGINYGGDY
jgi:hypothetical protein